MEFGFSCSKVLQANSQGFAILESKSKPRVNLNLIKSTVPRQASTGVAIYESNSSNPIDQIIDRMGMASSKAQQLPTQITSASKFFSTSDNKIYFKVQETKCIGFLKTGTRNLFQNRLGSIKEIRPICVLDFYVHESVQRGGHGKVIFEYMLRDLNVTPDMLAYDRPSIKLLSFLAKHYGLKQYERQSHNFVVFEQYFSTP